MKCPECRILHHLTHLIFLLPILKILPPIQNSTDNTDIWHYGAQSESTSQQRRKWTNAPSNEVDTSIK